MQPFICQVGGQLPDPYLIGIVELLTGLPRLGVAAPRLAGFASLPTARSREIALPTSHSIPAHTRRMRFTTIAFHARPDRGGKPFAVQGPQRSTHMPPTFMVRMAGGAAHQWSFLPGYRTGPQSHPGRSAALEQAAKV
jgi:hypothetical protein